MIRHVSISKEDGVVPEGDCFAWFSTVDDHFLEFSGNQVWRTWDEFHTDWISTFGVERQYPLERFEKLFPRQKPVNTMAKSLKAFMQWCVTERQVVPLMAVSYMHEKSKEYRDGREEAFRDVESTIGLLALEHGIDLGGDAVDLCCLSGGQRFGKTDIQDPEFAFGADSPWRNEIPYTVCYNGDVEKMSYNQYVRSRYFELAHDTTRYKLFIGRTIMIYDMDYLKAHDMTYKAVERMEEDSKKNPLVYFAPHGYPALEYLNDDCSDAKIIRAPNRFGKTCVGLIDDLLSVIPTDPNWMIFKENGVNHRPFFGPKKLGIATYKWSMHKQIVWPELRRWIPDSELGPYAQSFVGKGKKKISWERNPSVKLTCGTIIYFYVYEQDQDVFESQALDIWHWDEQGKEHLFDGADERLRTRSGRHNFTLTPHKVAGRPDTGAHSWIHKLASGEVTKGLQVREFVGSLADVPDWIYPEHEKSKAYKKWVSEPEKLGNTKVLREGCSRLYGEWHETAGLVYDEFQRDLHVIKPFKIPEYWTRFRAVDHGQRNPTACLCAAVNEKYDIVLFAEFYKRDQLISEACKGIIAACGNKRDLVDPFHDERSGFDIPRYEERFVANAFFRTVLDGRSIKQQEMGREIGWWYKANGLHVWPASGARSEKHIPAVKELLAIDPDRIHLATGKKGAPRVYIFDTLVNFIREIQGYVWDDHKVAHGKDMKESPRKKDDHLMNCIEYLAQIPLRFMGEIPGVRFEDEVEKHCAKSRSCGY